MTALRRGTENTENLRNLQQNSSRFDHELLEQAKARAAAEDLPLVRVLRRCLHNYARGYPEAIRTRRNRGE